MQNPIICHGLDTPETICFYEHEYYVFSNFSSFTLTLDSITFPTSEHAYHYLKFKDSSPHIALQILHAPSAHEAFQIAQQNSHLRRPDWDSIKVDIMRQIILAKTQQHPYVLKKLLASGTRTLIENSWRDSFWGSGPNNTGLNMLGKLWMELRSHYLSIQTPA